MILGVSGGIADLGQQYAVRSALPTLLDPVPPPWLAKLASWSEDSFPGILPNVAAGRVANRYDFGGVNYTVDAACASSLAAVHLASRELEAGTSDVVIVGGADTIQNPFAYLCFAKTHALSPRGRCATFDQGADGIAISEGVAILILKRLADAERDGDRVYAVIKGVAGSSDGRDKGLTAPRPEGQVLALQRAYAEGRCVAGDRRPRRGARHRNRGWRPGRARNIDSRVRRRRGRSRKLRDRLGQIDDRPHEIHCRSCRLDEGGAGAAPQGAPAHDSRLDTKRGRAPIRKPTLCEQ